MSVITHLVAFLKPASLDIGVWLGLKWRKFIISIKEFGRNIFFFMEIAYNLKYQKSSFRGRMLLEKEGEIIIYAKGFRLRGKGAGDKGEVVNFSEIKEFYFRNEKVIFVTFLKEKFVLSDVGTQFDQLIADLFKARKCACMRGVW